MTPLRKRERVLRAVRLQETDRIPTYDILQNDAVIEHYSGERLTVENGRRVKGLAIGRVLDATRMPDGPAAPGTRRDEEGLVYQVQRWTTWLIERPFHDLPGLMEWVRGRIKRVQARQFDHVYAEQFHTMIRDYQAQTAAGDPTGRGDPAVMIVESGAGLTEMYSMAGMELFSYLLAEDPGLVEEWLETHNQAELRRVAAIANPDVIPIALTYDDIAYKNATLFSPVWLRETWIPRLRRLVAAWHARDTVCLFHSDGNLWTVLDDLVAAGIDGLNPLEVLAGMTVKAVREKYPRLFLTGGVDVSQLLPHGTPTEVRAACRQNIQATQGRGYLLGSSTELHDKVKLENAIAMYETAEEI